VSKHTIEYVCVEAAWLRINLRSLFDLASHRASELQDIAAGAWDVVAADIHVSLTDDALLRRANQLRAFAARAATLSTDLACEAGRLDTLVSVRQSDQSEQLNASSD
jgi:hypothetical protein